MHKSTWILIIISSWSERKLQFYLFETKKDRVKWLSKTRNWIALLGAQWLVRAGTKNWWPEKPAQRTFEIKFSNRINEQPMICRILLLLSRCYYFIFLRVEMKYTVWRWTCPGLLFFISFYYCVIRIAFCYHDAWKKWDQMRNNVKYNFSCIRITFRIDTSVLKWVCCVRGARIVRRRWMWKNEIVKLLSVW